MVFVPPGNIFLGGPGGTMWTTTTLSRPLQRGLAYASALPFDSLTRPPWYPDRDHSPAQCCHSVMKKNTRIYLEKKPENNKKTQTYKMFKKSQNQIEKHATGRPTCT